MDGILNSSVLSKLLRLIFTVKMLNSVSSRFAFVFLHNISECKNATFKLCILICVQSLAWTKNVYTTQTYFRFSVHYIFQSFYCLHFMAECVCSSTIFLLLCFVINAGKLNAEFLMFIMCIVTAIEEIILWSAFLALCLLHLEEWLSNCSSLYCLYVKSLSINM